MCIYTQAHTHITKSDVRGSADNEIAVHARTTASMQVQAIRAPSIIRTREYLFIFHLRFTHRFWMRASIRLPPHPPRSSVRVRANLCTLKTRVSE